MNDNITYKDTKKNFDLKVLLRSHKDIFVSKNKLFFDNFSFKFLSIQHFFRMITFLNLELKNIFKMHMINYYSIKTNKSV